jgi:hypothetical protein
VHADLDVLGRGHGPEELDVLERARDPGRRDDVRALARQVAPEEHDGARRRLVEARQAVEERRLAGPVGPDQRDDRLLGHHEVDVADGHEAAEDLRDAPCLEDPAAVAVIWVGGRDRSAPGLLAHSWRTS